MGFAQEDVQRAIQQNRTFSRHNQSRYIQRLVTWLCDHPNGEGDVEGRHLLTSDTESDSDDDDGHDDDGRDIDELALENQIDVLPSIISPIIRNSLTDHMENVVTINFS